MDRLKKMFGKKYDDAGQGVSNDANDYVPPNKTASIFAGLADALLASETGRDPNYLGKIQANNEAAYKRKKQKEAADFENNLALNRDAREGEKFMRENDKYADEREGSKAFTQAILSQYPELKLEDVEGKDAMALATLIENQKTRRMMQGQYNTSRQDAINERFDQGKLESLSKRVEKSGAPEIEGSLNVVDALIAGKSDIPGVGMIDSLKPDWIVSPAGKTIRRNIAGAANQILKSRSGAAVTDPEYARFLNEAMTGKFTSEASLKSGLVKMRQDLTNMKSAIAKGYAPKIVKMYQDNGGDIELGTNQNMEKTVVKTQTNAKTGQKRVVYSDGTTEMIQ